MGKSFQHFVSLTLRTFNFCDHIAADKTPTNPQGEGGSMKVCHSLVISFGPLVTAVLWDAAYSVVRLSVLYSYLDPDCSH